VRAVLDRHVGEGLKVTEKLHGLSAKPRHRGN
jgi:hypothetical protein